MTFTKNSDQQELYLIFFANNNFLNIIRNSLRVKVHSDPSDMSNNSLVFEIEGAVFGQPSPFQIVLRSELNLECGEFRVAEDFG